MKRKTAVLALLCLPAVLFMGCSDLRAEDTATSTAAYAEEGGFDYGATQSHKPVRCWSVGTGSGSRFIGNTFRRYGSRPGPEPDPLVGGTTDRRGHRGL